MRTRARVRVAGRVQGVFFRESTAERAKRLGVRGWIKNNPDGTVEATFEGPQSKVREMVRWCEKGPELARVDNINVKYGKFIGEFNNFEIL